jgi:hypothetical protein
MPQTCLFEEPLQGYEVFISSVLKSFSASSTITKILLLPLRSLCMNARISYIGNNKNSCSEPLLIQHFRATKIVLVS